jgi:hypothetical protein
LSSPPFTDGLSRPLSNWLKPLPKPVGITGPVAPDPMFGAPWRQTAGAELAKHDLGSEGGEVPNPDLAG